MPDKGTTQDHVEDLMVQLALVRAELEDYAAANLDLRSRLALALEETRQAYKRADQYRAQVSALGDRFSAVCAINADLQRTLDEANND